MMTPSPVFSDTPIWSGLQSPRPETLLRRRQGLSHRSPQDEALRKPSGGGLTTGTERPKIKWWVCDGQPGLPRQTEGTRKHRRNFSELQILRDEAPKGSLRNVHEDRVVACFVYQPLAVKVRGYEPTTACFQSGREIKSPDE